MVSPNLGQLGEELTAQWLKSQGWKILACRWRCRWGELDLVAYHPSPEEKLKTNLIFVEVKTRSDHNWDENGLLAITPRKQSKLYQSAQMFLSRYPKYSEVDCRFDLALVKARKNAVIKNTQKCKVSVELNQPIFDQGYELTLVNYFKGIFP